MGKKIDAIVIGSGLGGLTAAAFLAKAGMRVCVLEKHHKIGGYAHSFERGPFIFESGIHSVPLAQQGFIRHLLRLLNVEEVLGQVVPHKNIFDFKVENYFSSLSSNKEHLLYNLTNEFPSQTENLKRLFENLSFLYDKLLLPLFNLEENFIEKDNELISSFYNVSYYSYLKRFITDEKLLTILCSQWPFWGVPAEGSPTLFCAMALYVHVLEGSHYIKEGFSNLANALALATKKRGGEIFTSTEVKELIVEKDRVKAVKTSKGEEIEASLFVANISPYLLYKKMIPEEKRSKLILNRLANLKPSVSAFALYCGLKEDIPLPNNSTLFFWFNSFDYMKLYKNIDTKNLKIEEPEHLIFLKTPETNSNPTLLIMTFCRAEQEKNWKEAKKVIAENILRTAEKILPGLKSSISLLEIATPTTFERYSGNTDGALYGFELTKHIYGEARLPNKSYIKNLFHASHWCKPGCGVWNVIECGYTTAKMILRSGNI
ncbi:MAG: NAD(P)/FAD-dependent oxidoreductase [Chitinispirillaceae bacterium]|nr:NAD(P)/FAD-dependent oxidoreductase [Chitinispirillaceae bacterium]